MGENFLIDTNILIYLVKSELPSDKAEMIKNIIEKSFNISSITKIEFLGWNKHSEQGYITSENLIKLANIIYLDKDLTNNAIEIKRKTNLKLGDAIIGATALKGNYVLLTRNSKDFDKIKDLKLYNPFEMQ